MLYNYQSVQIKDSVFAFNSASEATAGLSIRLSSSWSAETSVVLSNCNFFNNTAQSHTALNVYAANLTLLNSTFKSNTATATDAGALALACSIGSGCDFYVADTVFMDNSALLRGGAIAWTYQPKLANVTFTNNSAVYGPDVASYGVRLVRYDQASSKPAKTAESDYLGLASGQRMPEPIVIALVDHEGFIVKTDNTSVAQIFAEDTASTSVVGSARVSAEQGVYYFAEAIVSAYPGSNIRLKFESDVLQVNSSDGLTIEVAVRPCQAGETLIGLDCLRCSPGTYSLDPSDQCSACPQGATCFGGSLMVPQAGYWRPDRTSDHFLECLKPQACLGSPHIVPALTGDCARGYQGNLCHSCQRGFSRTSPSTCEECPEQALNIIRLVGTGLGVSVFCGVLVWSSLKTAYMPKSLHSIYLKIFTNYLQLIVLTTELDLDWPEYARSYFEALSYTSSVGQQILSLDCFLNSTQQDSVYFSKKLISAVVPLFLGSVALGYWSVVSLVKRRQKIIGKELVATLVVLFFLVHPSLVKEYFDVFNCTQLEGQLWVGSDLSIKCFDDRYLTYVLGVTIPAILVWGIGVPSLILGVLVRRRRLLDKLSMKCRFGFFYNGYRRTHFYWEFLILYRKIMLVCLVVFVGKESIPIRALSMMLLCLMFLFLQYWQSPYTLEQLNQMELRGVIVASITIYCGLYYLTRSLTEWAKLSLLGVMIAANCFFLYFFVIHFSLSLLLSIAQHIPGLRRRFLKADSFPGVSVAHSPLSKTVYTLSDDPGKILTLAVSAEAQPRVSLNVEDMDSYFGAQLDTVADSY
jgi:predicted outer membrane repeat protein